MSSKILAFSNYDKNFAEINDLTYAHNKKYFDKYNIEYLAFNNSVEQLMNISGDNVTKCYYIKWIILYNLLQTRSDIDYFFAIDTDIIICDFDIDLRVFTKMSKRDILICSVEDCAPDMFWNVNAGSMIVKNTPKSKAFVQSYLDIAKSYNYDIIDQPLLQNFLAQNASHRSLFSVFPACAFNHGGPQSFLYHDCGTSTSNRPLAECLEKKLSNLASAIKTINQLEN